MFAVFVFILPFFIYLDNIPRVSFFCLFVATFTDSIERSPLSLSLSSSLPQLYPAVSRSSHLTVSVVRILAPLPHFSLSRGRFSLLRSSLVPRSHVTPTLFAELVHSAFSLRVTEHSIEPGRTVPSGRPSLPAHTLSSIPPSLLPVSIN